MNFRPTQAVIDLKALQQNYHEVVQRLPENCPVLAMVKADAYGHGVLPVAKTLEPLGVRAFGVATIEEGIEIRTSGIKREILVMGGLMGRGIAAAKVLLEYQLTPVIHSVDALEILDRLGGEVKEKLKVHLQVDTGMTRLGVTSQALPQLIESLKKSFHVKIEGVLTHLAWRQNRSYTKRQVKLFKEMGEKILEVIPEIPVWHVANSASVIEGSPIGFEWKSEYWVRPGIMLYGIPPYPEYRGRLNLHPVLSLVSKIYLIKNVPKGTKVSYNCTFTTKRPSRIGVVPIGYADGYPWMASNKSKVLVAGRRASLLGRVTMDMIMIDVTDIHEAKVGSEVVLLGRQGQDAISADELAAWSNSFAYEIVCRVSKRIPRVYLT